MPFPMFESLNQNNNYSIALIQQVQCPVQGKRYSLCCSMEGSLEFSFEIVSYFLSELEITQVLQHLQQGEQRKWVHCKFRLVVACRHNNEAAANTFKYFS